MCDLPPGHELSPSGFWFVSPETLAHERAIINERAKAHRYFSDLVARDRAVRTGVLDPFDAIDLRPPAEYLGAVTMDKVAAVDPPEPKLGRYAPGHNIVYGTGGVGKGTLLVHDIGEMARDGHRPLILDYENHLNEWKPRLEGLGYGDVMDRIMWVGPNTPEWQGPLGAIWTQTDHIRSLAHQHEADVLVIDSIVFACAGADASAPESATTYGRALNEIGVELVVSLAHITKEHALKYPFGSVFWHNGARMTWSMERQATGILLVNRKSNNYMLAKPQLVTVTWVDKRPRDLHIRPYTEAIGDQIARLLATKSQMTDRELHKEINTDLDEGESETSLDTVQKTLKRGAKPNKAGITRFDIVDGHWKLWEPPTNLRELPSIPAERATQGTLAMGDQAS
jgi:hypothetical protein